MRRRLIRGVAAAAALAAVPLLTAVPAAGQRPAAPRTAWGDPDLEGARFQEKEAAELAAKGAPR
jgi:hypothetical protein